MKKIFTAALLITLALPLCRGNTISDSQQQYVEKYRKQKTVPLPEAMLLNTESEPEIGSEFTVLFNGTNLAGWVQYGGPHTYEAKGGVIVGTVVQGAANAFLCTEAEYSNFIFTCEMKWLVDGNSGVMLRAQTRPGKNNEGDIRVYGPQCEMEGFASGRGWSGGIYGEAVGGWFYPLWLDAHKEVRGALKENEWNRITILADGDTIKTWLNGIPASHWKTEEYMKGIFGLQVHSGKQGAIQWRNIKLKEL